MFGILGISSMRGSRCSLSLHVLLRFHNYSNFSVPFRQNEMKRDVISTAIYSVWIRSRPLFTDRVQGLGVRASDCHKLP